MIDLSAGRIDLHAHAVPAGYIDAVERRFPGSPIPPLDQSLSFLLARMDEYGTAAAVVSIGAPPPPPFEDATKERELIRIANEGLALMRQARPDRIGALGMLPLPDVDASLGELAYVFDTLGLDGIRLPSNADGVYLGDERFRPILDELNRRGAYVFLHPEPPTHAACPGHPPWLYEMPFDTTRTVTDLLYAGAFARAPAIRWQLAHLGGAVPFLAHRLAWRVAREPGHEPQVPDGVLTYLRQLYYDTGLSSNSPALAAAIELVGVDQLVFGSDWPAGLIGAHQPPDPAPGLARLGADRERVERANALRLVPRFGVAPRSGSWPL